LLTNAVEENWLLMSTIAYARIRYLQTRIARFEDQQAYKELYLTLYPAIFNFISGIVKSKPVAEEIISDVFIKIWEKRLDLDLIANLNVYCYVIAKNLSFNYLEKQKRISTLNIEDFSDSLTERFIDPEQLMITSEMADRIRLAIDSLPARCKMIFTLVKENGFKYKEVAEIMNISDKTVENQLAIALKKISVSINFDMARSLRVTLGSGH
jgi:RNA polymerase sigma-70 factor (ECF subfamily)